MGVFVGIEAGGTKFICAHGKDPSSLSDRVRIETSTPDETMRDVCAYIGSVSNRHEIESIGVACFGPIELDKSSDSYGRILSTPKLPWRNFNIVQALVDAFAVPVGFDTDVNAAALGEQRWGAGVGVDSLLYITIGTGIGVGVVSAGRIYHAAMHPEAGHIRVPHLREDEFSGVCPYHGDCLEGLASGPAIKERWQVDSALRLPSDHPAWQMESTYLAYAIHNYSLCYAPKRVILGGGVMRQPGLLPLIQKKVIASLAGYMQHPYLNETTYIVKTGLGEDSGIVGALALAERALLTQKKEK